MSKPIGYRDMAQQPKMNSKKSKMKLVQSIIKIQMIQMYDDNLTDIKQSNSWHALDHAVNLLEELLKGDK